MSNEVCNHIRLTPSAACYVMPDPEAPRGFYYAVAVAVFCPDCRARFQFLGNNALAPQSYAEAQRSRVGAWVSGNLCELACVLAPVEPSGGLADVEVAGRA